MASKVEEGAATDDVSKHSLGAGAKAGAFVRRATKFHARVTRDGSSGFKAEKGRYHLIVTHACPWAHRCEIVRKLKGLEDVIGITHASWHFVHRTADGTYATSYKGGNNGGPEDYRGWALDEPDPFFGVTTLGDFYEKASPGYYASYLPSRVPVSTPVLFDTKTRTIVNNESSQIIRMFNTEFNEWATRPDLDLEPEELKAEMSRVDDIVYPNINDGVYRNGFAQTQEAYDDAATNLWRAMDTLEELLATRRYTAGSKFTLSDVRLFVTLARFDPVYVTHFKCNRNRLTDMPNLFNFTKELYQMPGIADTFNWERIRMHYYKCHRSVNPFGIVPIGLRVDFLEPHDRAKKFPETEAATTEAAAE